MSAELSGIGSALATTTLTNTSFGRIGVLPMPSVSNLCGELSRKNRTAALSASRWTLARPSFFLELTIPSLVTPLYDCAGGSLTRRHAG
jgi:hypothetical protein